MNKQIQPRTRRGRVLALLMTGLVAACEGPVMNAPAEHPQPPSLVAETGPQLAVGASGEEVAAVHRYLSQYGYFPSPRLARAFPSWRPIVEMGPANTSVFDAQTEAAVRALQRRAGLTPTGRVDQATRTLLRQPRCHEPDGLVRVNPADKFAYVLGNPRWNKTSITWRYTKPQIGGIDPAQAKPALQAAFDTWAAVTNLTFTETSGVPDIEISWASLGAGAEATPPPNAIIRFNIFGGLTTASPTPSGQTDFQSAALHEIGHTMGIHHTDILPATSIMFGVNTGQQKRTLGSDDILAAKIAYDPWTFVRNHMIDVSHSAGRFWGISDGFPETTSDPNVFRLDPSNLGGAVTVANQTGIRISVGPDGIPWVVRSNGNIRRRNSADGSDAWNQLGGCGLDVGSGGTAAAPVVWVIGCSGSLEGTPYRFNGSGWVADTAGQIGARIAVDSGGIPWLVKLDGTVLRRSADSTSTGSWSAVGANIGARDIAVDNTGPAIWAFVTTGNNGIFARNDQVGNGLEGAADTPTRMQWIQLGGRGRAISVRDNTVLVIDPNFELYRLLK